MNVGQIIDGRWTIIEIKGRGGQGEVFKVSDSVTNSYYALKFLNKQNNIERRNRMFKEVCNVKCLSDRHTQCKVSICEKLYCFGFGESHE